MADVENLAVTNIEADSAHITDLSSGNLIVTGAARFVQPIYADINGSKDINQVSSASSIPDSWTVIVSDGTSIHRITFANLCSAIATKLGIDPTKNYLYD